MNLKELEKQLPTAFKNLKVKNMKQIHVMPEEHIRLIERKLRDLIESAEMQEDESLTDYFDDMEIIRFTIDAPECGYSDVRAEITVYRKEHTESGKPNLDIDIIASLDTHKLHLCFEWSGKKLKQIDTTKEDDLIHDCVVGGVTEIIAERNPEMKELKNIAGNKIYKTSIRKVFGDIHEVGFTFTDEHGTMLETQIIMTANEMVAMASHLLNREPRGLLRAISDLKPLNR